MKQVQQAQPRADWVQGPKFGWREQSIAMAPDEADFAKAAGWSLSVPKISWSATVPDAFIQIRYQGDAARLSCNGKLLDDNFWNGQSWTIGLRELFGDGLGAGPVELGLQILPLPQKYPMFLQQAEQLQFRNGFADGLGSITITPQYRVTLTPPRHP